MDGVVFISAVLFCVGGVAFGEYNTLQYSFCESNNVIRVSNLQVTPMPILHPGNLMFSGDFEATRPVRSASLTLSVKRQTYLLDIPIPCFMNVGSCTYSNICTLVDEMITENWAGVIGQIGRKVKYMFESRGAAYNKCPIPAREVLSIRDEPLRMPALPRVLSWLTNGDYKIQVLVKDNISGERLLCLDLGLSFTKSCTGFSCYFGK